MYYNSRSFITPVCVLIVWRSKFVFIFSLIGNFLSLCLAIADLNPSFSNFAPNDYTYIDFLEFNTAPQL